MFQVSETQSLITDLSEIPDLIAFLNSRFQILETVEKGDEFA